MSAEPPALFRTLCCGATCGRGSLAQGPCVAGTYGRAILQRIEAAGYNVVKLEDVARRVLDHAADQWATGLSITINGRSHPIGHMVAEQLRATKITITDNEEARADG